MLTLLRLVWGITHVPRVIPSLLYWSFLTLLYSSRSFRRSPLKQPRGPKHKKPSSLKSPSIPADAASRVLSGDFEASDNRDALCLSVTNHSCLQEASYTKELKALRVLDEEPPACRRCQTLRHRRSYLQHQRAWLPGILMATVAGIPTCDETAAGCRVRSQGWRGQTSSLMSGSCSSMIFVVLVLRLYRCSFITGDWCWSAAFESSAIQTPWTQLRAVRMSVHEQLSVLPVNPNNMHVNRTMIQSIQDAMSIRHEAPLSLL